MRAEEIQKIACLGTGVIGASWCTNFVMKGSGRRLQNAQGLFR